MPEITLITTSPFPGQEQLKEVTFPSLMSQTTHDFIWMYLDGCYSHNKSLFAAFAEAAPFDVMHLPLMHDNRSPRKFHWEPYNSALLMCRTKNFLRWGRFRRYHRRAVEEAIGFMTNPDRMGSRAICVDFAQKQSDDPSIRPQRPPMEPGANAIDGDIRWHLLERPHSSCGMFGMSVDVMIDELNGNDEVGLHQNHFEDVEMNGRMKNMNGVVCMKTENGLVRYTHNKDYRSILRMDRPVPISCGSPGCPHVAPGFAGRRQAIKAANHCVMTEFEGMDFWTCQRCGAFAPGDADEYRDWAHSRGATRAMTNIAGHGRDLSAVRDRLRGLTSTSSMVEVIEGSYG